MLGFGLGYVLGEGLGSGLELGSGSTDKKKGPDPTRHDKKKVDIQYEILVWFEFCIRFVVYRFCIGFGLVLFLFCIVYSFVQRQER